jgi:hypothetical protein
VGTLERYVNLIAESPLLEKKLESLKERRSAESARVNRRRPSALPQQRFRPS